VKRKLKSKCCILLFLIIIMSVSLCVNAKSTTVIEEAEINQTRYTYIDIFINSFNISKYGYADISSYLDAYGVDQVRITAYLQQYNDGYWQTVKHWTDIKDRDWNTLDVGRYVTSGYSYRCITYGYVYINGFIVEVDFCVSNYVFY